MRTLFIDPFAGVAGDMFVGAILDLGVINEEFWTVVNDLDFPGVSLREKKVLKAGISSTKFCVETEQGRALEPHADDMHAHSNSHGHHHHHGHGHTDDHGHDHNHHHNADETSALPAHHHHHRSYKEVVHLIDHLDFDETAKEYAKSVFKLIGEAEAEIHGKTLESIHFHEVGAWDAIADISCACIAMNLLKAEQVICRPIALGGGTVKAAHGIMPVPAPATALLLKGLPSFGGPAQRELTTPTGAALLKFFVDKFDENYTGVINEIGYGAGNLEFKTHANALKVTLYDSLRSQVIDKRQEARDYLQDEVAVIDFSIDDSTAEQVAFYADELLELGALDVFRQFALSKKGREATLFTVLCQREDFDKLAERIFNITGSLGLRYRFQKRYKLKRKLTQFHSAFGQICVKVRGYSNNVLGFKPEFDDCQSIAKSKNLNLKELYHKVQEAFAQAISGKAFDEIPEEIFETKQTKE